MAHPLRPSAEPHKIIPDLPAQRESLLHWGSGLWKAHCLPLQPHREPRVGLAFRCFYAQCPADPATPSHHRQLCGSVSLSSTPMGALGLAPGPRYFYLLPYSFSGRRDLLGATVRDWRPLSHVCLSVCLPVSPASCHVDGLLSWPSHSVAYLLRLLSPNRAVRVLNRRKPVLTRLLLV